jgi:flagellar export protein FliJ
MRRTVRAQRQQQLAEVLRQADVLRARRDELGRELEVLKARRAAPGGDIDLTALLEIDRYMAVLRDTCRQIDQRHESLEAEIQSRRQELIDADRDVRVIEKIHDTREKRRLAAYERAATKELDEFGQRCHGA